MKDINNVLKGKYPRIQRCKNILLQSVRRLVGTRAYKYQSILLQFIRKLTRTGTCHILIDEVEYSSSLLEELHTSS